MNSTAAATSVPSGLPVTASSMKYRMICGFTRLQTDVGQDQHGGEGNDTLLLPEVLEQ